jgi:hypothetical protein
MLDFFEWIVRWSQIIPWLVMGASAIAAITPTPKDDAWIGKAYKVLDFIALNIGKAKDTAQSKNILK